MRGAAIAGLFLLAASAGSAIAQGVSAILEPVQLVEIKSTVAGRLDEITVTEGASVSTGDRLASLDARVQTARLGLSRIAAEATGPSDRARIIVDQAEILLERVRKAQAKGAAKAWEVFKAEQALTLAQADAQVTSEGTQRLVAQMELELAMLEQFSMRAPFPGTVLQVFAEPGEIVSSETPIMELGNLYRLEATAFVPVGWVDQLVPGGTLDATLLMEPARPVELRIVSVDPRMDPASRSVRIRIALDNSAGDILAGSSVQLQAP